MEMLTPDAVNVRDGVAARLERLPLTNYQKVIFTVIATAWLFDSMDLGIMTFVLGSIKSEFALSATQAGLLASRWVTAESGRRRRVYALTRRGDRALAERRVVWRQFSDAIGGLLAGTPPSRKPA